MQVLPLIRPVVLGGRDSKEYFPVGMEARIYRGNELGSVLDSGEARALRECSARMKKLGQTVCYAELGGHFCCLEKEDFYAGDVPQEMGVSHVQGDPLVSA